MNKYFFGFLFAILALPLSAQNYSIDIPQLVEVNTGERVVFTVDWESPAKETHSLSWKSSILDARFDPQEREFFWSTSKEDVGLHKAIFFIKDSLNKILFERQTIIKVNEIRSRPIIKLSPDSINSRPYISLDQGTSYQLEFEAIPLNGTSKEIILTYVLDNDSDLKQFSDSEFHILGNKILVSWKPNQKQADRKYFSMEVVAIDALNMVSRRQYEFKIIDKDMPPELRYSINNNYIITADQELTIDFSAVDQDNEPILYSVDIPVTVGNPQINEKGLFIWKLTATEMSNIASVFPLEVTLRAQESDDPQSILEKVITINKSDKNTPPVITRLSNLSIREGYTIKRRVFIKDNNHAVDQLNFYLENQPEWLYIQQEANRVYIMSDTIDFDVVKADGIPVQYDVLLTVEDPEGASDAQFFNVTVNEGINMVKVYRDLQQYERETAGLLVGLRKKIFELDDKLQKHQNLKKTLSFSSFFLGTISATGSFFDDNTIVNQSVPFAGAILAVSSSINALAFNQDGKIASLKSQLESIEKSIVRNKSYLRTYSIEDENDEELRNSDLVNRLTNYRRALIEQKIELEKLEDEYRELNYVQRRIRRYKRKGKLEQLGWDFVDLR